MSEDAAITWFEDFVTNVTNYDYVLRMSTDSWERNNASQSGFTFSAWTFQGCNSFEEIY